VAKGAAPPPTTTACRLVAEPEHFRSINCSVNWKELLMSHSTMELTPQAGKTAQPDPFDLDISVLESGDAAATLINLTDDGCGSTCASPCATNMG